MRGKTMKSRKKAIRTRVYLGLVLALSLCAGATLLEAAVIANAAAGVVIGKIGTATASVAETRELLGAAIEAAEEVS